MKMELSEALKKFGTDGFEDARAGELSENVEELPTQKGCLWGGWPEAVEILTVDNVDSDADNVYADFTVCFDEVWGTGCSNVPLSAPRQITCQVTISKECGRSSVEALEDADEPDEI